MEGLKISELIEKLEEIKENYGDVRTIFVPFDKEPEMIKGVVADWFDNKNRLEIVAELL